MNKIEIEIPVDKEVDWEASAKQKQIVLVLFKSKELAQQAIKILGEETVKLALEPLY